MNDCASSSTQPASDLLHASTSSPELLAAYDRGYRDCAHDILGEVTKRERATLLRQVSTPKE